MNDREKHNKEMDECRERLLEFLLNNEEKTKKDKFMIEELQTTIGKPISDEEWEEVQQDRKEMEIWKDDIWNQLPNIMKVNFSRAAKESNKSMVDILLEEGMLKIHPTLNRLEPSWAENTSDDERYEYYIQTRNMLMGEKE